MKGNIFHFLLIVTVFHFAGTNGVSFDEDTAITAQEAEVLFKFRDRVRSKLPHKYMEEIIYLVKWLRAGNFDMNTAEDLLTRNLKWRADNHMDHIDNEDWEDFKSDYEWNLDGLDKEGRPLVQFSFKDWDIRSAMVTGRGSRLNRWVYKYFEDATKLIRKFQQEGKNVTQFTLLIDMEGFSPVTHSCPVCLPFYLTVASAYEQHYPGSLDKIHITNTPQLFRVIIQLIWPALSQETRKALTLHSTDRAAWRRILSETIDDSQLLPVLGGTLKAE